MATDVKVVVRPRTAAGAIDSLLRRMIPRIGRTIVLAVQRLGARRLERWPALGRFLVAWMRWTQARSDVFPNWAPIVDEGASLWRSARATPAATAPRVLMASAVGAHATMSTLESGLAAALTLRGATVDVLLCDETLPACIDCSVLMGASHFVNKGPAQLCRDCRRPTEHAYAQLGLTIHRLGECLEPSDKAEARRLAECVPEGDIESFRLDGMAIGQHAMAAAIRFFAVGSLDGERLGAPVLRRYFEAALLTAFAMRRLLSRVQFTTVVATHGIYVPWGVITEGARKHGVHVVNWCAAYRKGRFVFSHDVTYHHELITEPVEHWDGKALSSNEETELTELLAARRHGRGDWKTVHRSDDLDARAVIAKLGLDPTKPIVGLLTNVIWDAQVHYPNRAFKSMLDWLVRTCEYIGQRPDLQLLIRVHPSEVTGNPQTRQSVVTELQRRMPSLPGNIAIVPPESGASTYALMSECNAVAIYATVTGIELTTLGIPVIVAGEAWIRNKGIAREASNEDEYFSLLDQLPLASGMRAEEVERARRYAYHFFFRRLIALPFAQQRDGQHAYRLTLETLDDLLPGRSRSLDVVCDGVLHRAPFILA